MAESKGFWAVLAMDVGTQLTMLFFLFYPFSGLQILEATVPFSFFSVTFPQACDFSSHWCCSISLSSHVNQHVCEAWCLVKDFWLFKGCIDKMKQSSKMSGIALGFNEKYIAWMYFKNKRINFRCQFIKSPIYLFIHKIVTSIKQKALVNLTKIKQLIDKYNLRNIKQRSFLMIINELLQSGKELIIIRLKRTGHQSHSLQTSSKNRKWQNADILFLKQQSHKLLVTLDVTKVFEVEL